MDEEVHEGFERVIKLLELHGKWLKDIEERLSKLESKQ